MAILSHRRLAAPSYIAAFSLIVFPIFDQAMQLVPTAKIHDPRWRFGGAGLLSNMLVLPVVGLTIAFAVSAAFEHRGFQRVLAILSVVAGLIVIVATGLFALDAIQVRALMRPEAMSSWLVATSTAIGKFLVAIVALAGFGYAGLRVTNAPSSSRPARPSGLVIGSAKARASSNASSSTEIDPGTTAKG